MRWEGGRRSDNIEDRRGMSVGRGVVGGGIGTVVIAVIIVAGTFSLLRQSVHLLFDGVPDSVNLREVEALLGALPGVTRVHDLHVWAMGTSEIAMTAHLVMPGAAPDDAFLQDATRQLHDRFGIEHVTLQAVRVPFTQPCSPAGAAVGDGDPPVNAVPVSSKRHGHGGDGHVHVR